MIPSKSGVFYIDPDASSAGYFWGLDWLLARSSWLGNSTPGSKVEVVLHQWFVEEWQIDAKLPSYLGALPAQLSRKDNLGDSIMMAIVLAPFASHGVLFTDLGRLRVQECERVAALRTELTRCGAEVVEYDDCLRVSNSPIHGAEIETYDDHRMAMCFAILGLKIPGIKLKNPSCVKKTFPDFFLKLAAPPPQGLGAKILDGHTGRILTGDELFAA
jgi:3-phosphoshikimate 1-carboxyvinyltransferase